MTRVAARVEDVADKGNFFGVRPSTTTLRSSNYRHERKASARTGQVRPNLPWPVKSPCRPRPTSSRGVSYSSSKSHRRARQHDRSWEEVSGASGPGGLGGPIRSALAGSPDRSPRGSATGESIQGRRRELGWLRRLRNWALLRHRDRLPNVPRAGKERRLSVATVRRSENVEIATMRLTRASSAASWMATAAPSDTPIRATAGTLR